MDVRTLTKSEEVATVGRKHWKAVKAILQRHDERLWNWEAVSFTKAEVTVYLTCQQGWELHDDLSDYFEGF